jgi:hypothetical protein
MTEHNLRQFVVGAGEYHKDLVPTVEQIKAAVARESSKKASGADKTNPLQATAEMIYLARTKEEEIVKGILNQWGKGAHGFVPMVKEDDIVQLGCENVNSLSMYNQKETKMRRIINLHEKYQMDATCILEHGTNFSMLPEGKRMGDLCDGMPWSWVSTAQNTNESISWCQQGGTLVVAFSHLAGFVQETGVNRTGLG